VRRLIYELFLETKRKKAVARILNERGYRTRGGATFSDTTIDRLIRDPSAKGPRRANYTRSRGDGKAWDLKPKDEWVFHAVEPIVDEELWERCNAVLIGRRKEAKAPGRQPVHLFAGVVHCTCGQKMYVYSESPKYTSKECRNRIGITDLEAVFQEQLKGFLLSAEDVAAYLSQADEALSGKEEALKKLGREESKVRSEMDRIYRAYVADQISVEGFGRQYRPLEERLKQIEEELPRLQGEVDFMKIQLLSRNEVLSGARDLHARWPQLSPEEKRQIVEAVVEEIRVGKEEVEIDLAYFPALPAVNSKRMATQSHRCVANLPLRLCGSRPRVVPRGYPHEPRTLGEQIHQRRMDLGLTQRTLAERLGCCYQSVARWERDKGKPGPKRWPALEAVLGPGLVPVEVGTAGGIRTARLRLGLTQAELARRAGVDVRTVRNWERGVRRPRRETRRRVWSAVEGPRS
jgi:DNA-binding transcriptional regulator YiaG